MVADRLDEVVEAASRLEAGGVRLALVRRERPGDGFRCAAELHRPGALLDSCIAGSARTGDTENLQVGAQWWFERCAWLAATTVLACAATSRCVPSLEPADVLVTCDAEAPPAIGLRDAPLACSEGGLADLAAAARAELERHLSPLVAAIATQRLRPARQLWWSAGDRVVQAALWTGEASGRRDEMLALARALLVPPGPIGVPVRVAVTEDGCRQHKRSSCCLSYRTPAALVCAGCPRRR